MPQPTEFDYTGAGRKIVIAENQPPYLPLPAVIYGDGMGTILTCWQFSESELAEIGKTGKLFVTMLTFNQPIQPLAMMVEQPSDEVIRQLGEPATTTGTHQVLKYPKGGTVPSGTVGDPMSEDLAQQLADKLNQEQASSRYFWKVVPLERAQP